MTTPSIQNLTDLVAVQLDTTENFTTPPRAQNAQLHLTIGLAPTANPIAVFDLRHSSESEASQVITETLTELNSQQPIHSLHFTFYGKTETACKTIAKQVKKTHNLNPKLFTIVQYNGTEYNVIEADGGDDQNFTFEQVKETNIWSACQVERALANHPRNVAYIQAKPTKADQTPTNSELAELVSKLRDSENAVATFYGFAGQVLDVADSQKKIVARDLFFTVLATLEYIPETERDTVYAVLAWLALASGFGGVCNQYRQCMKDREGILFELVCFSELPSWFFDGKQGAEVR